MSKNELNKALEAMKITKKESENIKGGGLCKTCVFSGCVTCVSCYGCVACRAASVFGE